MLLILVENIGNSWRTAAVDTSVANAMLNVDALHPWKTAERLQLWTFQLETLHADTDSVGSV